MLTFLNINPFFFMENKEQSKMVDISTLKPDQDGFLSISDIKLINDVTHKNLDNIKLILDDINPQIQQQNNKITQEQIKEDIHECSKNLELSKSYIVKMSECKAQSKSDEIIRKDLLKALMEKFIIVREDLSHTILSEIKEQNVEVTNKRQTIQRLSIVQEKEDDQDQKMKYQQDLYDEEQALIQRQKEIQEVILELSNVIGMIEVIDQKIEEQGIQLETIATATENANQNLEQAKKELITVKRIRQDELSDPVFYVMLGSIVVVTMVMVSAV